MEEARALLDDYITRSLIMVRIMDDLAHSRYHHRKMQSQLAIDTPIFIARRQAATEVAARAAAAELVLEWGVTVLKSWSEQRPPSIPAFVSTSGVPNERSAN
jgi:hypothetical protein